MFNVCVKCGSYHADKIIDPAGPYAICPECGHPHEFKQLPLFIITGASGTGKTSVCLELAKAMNEVVAMEGDILWRSEFINPDNDYRDYREMWLRVCKNISQGGRPVVLCGSAVPSQFENCVERRYFTGLHYLALICDDNLLVDRLKARPAWRKSCSDEFIKVQAEFNKWFKDNADKAENKITLCDTTYDSMDKTIEKIRRWIIQKL